MASMSSSYGPKLRSRKHGAAVPLDELDKRLLNLMQGSFPIAPRPYQHVAAEAGITEEEAIERVARAARASASSARSRRSSTPARSATRRCWSPPRSTPRTRGARPR